MIDDARDADWYRLTAPTRPTSGAMKVPVRAMKCDKMPPTLVAFDAAGNPLQAEVLRGG